MRLRALVLIATLIGSMLMTAPPSGATHSDPTTLTVTPPSHGNISDADGLIDCGLGSTDCTETYDAEEVICNPSCTYTHPIIELTATAQSGWSFEAWSGACSSETTTTCQLGMGFDRTVGASFTDASAPTVSMATPAAGWHSDTVTLSANADDFQSGITRVDFHVLPPSGCCWTELANDFSGPYAFPWNSNFPWGTSGTYTLRARATNGEGMQTLSAEKTIDIDNLDPTIAWDNPPQAGPATVPVNGDGLPLRVEAADTTSSVDGVEFLYSTTDQTSGFASLDEASEATPGEWEYLWTDLSQFSTGQSVWVKGRATDEAGNTKDSSVIEFVVDKASPSVQLTQGPAGGSYRRFTSETFAFSASETLGSAECTAWRVDDPSGTEKLVSCGAGTPFTFSGLTDGRWTVRVIATDPAANQTVVDRSWIVDTIKPNTKLTSGPKRRTKARKATFRFRSTEAGSKFQCKLDRQRYKSCSSPKVVRRLKKGRHTMRIRAVDRAGNVDGTPVSKTWRVV